MLKQNSASSQSFRPKNKPSSLAPYDQLPIRLHFHHLRPFSQILNNSQYCLARREKVRNITHQTLEKDFKERHDNNHSKESEMLRTFKIRCRRKEEQGRTVSNEEYFMGQLAKRQQELRRLNEEYLGMVRAQLGREGEGQKIIGEYNIIYEYRADLVENKVAGRGK